jgi:hypothetical protein
VIGKDFPGALLMFPAAVLVLPAVPEGPGRALRSSFTPGTVPVVMLTVFRAVVVVVIVVPPGGV